MILLSRLTRRLIEWRGGYRAAQVLIGLLGGVTPVEAEVLGLRMWLDPRDYACRMLLYYPQLYEPAERAALLPQIRPEDVVIDVGAHFGFYSLLASKRAASVLSIEADPKTFRYLERNLAMNRAANVRAVQAGVSDRRERLKLFGNDALGDLSGHSFVPGDGRNDAVEVQCFPLIDIMKAQGFDHCDVLKIDVEGFEYRVLKPLFEQAAFRPRLVLVEYYEQRNTGDVLTLLRNQGYQLSLQTGRDYLFALAESQ
ncbi:FkbM family methyltransferase [Candidatus Binatus soli]|uniref:FkbM family methyltransferase n=1 Tax=Candidatus Binatus soli TaxID=1953413 RepID=UPI003D0EB994